MCLQVICFSSESFNGGALACARCWDTAVGESEIESGEVDTEQVMKMKHWSVMIGAYVR